MVIRLARPAAFHETLAEMVALADVTCRELSVTDTSGVPTADETGGVGVIVVEGVGAIDEGAVIVVVVEGAVPDEGAVVVLVEGGVAADTGDATYTTPAPTHVMITTPVSPAARHERMA
jgi:hypothetical protein